MRLLLRNLKSLAGPFPSFDVLDTADDPLTQFSDWLKEAIAADISEPHAMTLSTVDERGFPDARVLILKNLDANGWHFAVSALSPKGRHIAKEPQVALTFYWQKIGRQVRIRGTAVDMGATTSAADFLARPQGSRAGTLMSRQSDVLERQSDLDKALAEQRRRLTENPDIVDPCWKVYAVYPEQVEFWQADAQRNHKRLKYTSIQNGWSKDCLWP